MQFYPYEFETVVEEMRAGRATYRVIWLPTEIAAELPFEGRKRLRIEAELADYPVVGTWLPKGKRHYLMVGRRTLREAGLKIGQPVRMRFRVADQDSVDVPVALQNAIDADGCLYDAWNDLTVGKQRSYAYRVWSAKREETIAKRVKEVARELLNE